VCAFVGLHSKISLLSSTGRMHRLHL